MLVRLFIISFIFYILGLVQNSFFVHFNILGASPNFIFIFFFILIFFSEENRISRFEDLFYCFVAGFFADIFSFSILGISFILFLALNIAFKKVFNSLKQRKNRRPLTYFIPLFLALFIAYNIIYETINGGQDILKFAFLIKVIYNLFFTVFGFYIYKIFQKIQLVQRKIYGF